MTIIKILLARIQPVTLSAASQSVGGSVAVTVSGWGRTSDSKLFFLLLYSFLEIFQVIF